MADESRRFVDNQQFTVLKNDVKKFFQARKIATESQSRRENCGIMSSTEADGRVLTAETQRRRENLTRINANE